MNLDFVTEFWSIEQKQEITDALNFYASILFHPRTNRNIWLDLDVDPELDFEGCLLNEDATANPRSFTITLRCHPSDDDPLKTLAHELVHMKQYISGDLQDTIVITKGSKFELEPTWKGKPWKPKGKEHPYYDSPWEIEAEGRGYGLYRRWQLSNEVNCRTTKSFDSLETPIGRY